MLFAVHGAEGVATALLAYRFAAIAAICRGRHFWMILAVHFSPSTCCFNAMPRMDLKRALPRV